MDDFYVVLGLEILNKVTVVSVLFMSLMCIMEGKVPCIVSTVVLEKLPKDGPSCLAALQFKKRVSHGEPSFLAALVEDHPGDSDQKLSQ